jgi:hypothetical protein
MPSRFTLVRFVLVLVVLLVPWRGAFPAAASPDSAETPATGLASLPVALQDVAAATLGATPQGKLSVFGAPGDNFGYAVALSGDGSTAIIGANNTDVAEEIDTGVAYIFVRVGETWQHQATLCNYPLAAQTAGEQANSPAGGQTRSFGRSVSLSDDGNTALIGAPESNLAFFFTRSGTTWTKLGVILPDDVAADDYFGWSVALSGDGLSAVISAPNADISGLTNQGAAYLFTLVANTWTQQKKFTASDGAASDYLGWSVAIGDNGLTILLGAPSDDIGANTTQGSAYVFARPLGTWVQTKITASDGAKDDWFGSAVALSGDGGTALISGTPLFTGGTDAAYVYTRKSGVTWGDEQKLVAAGSGRFGRSLAISDVGSVVLIGSTLDDIEGKADQGAAYIFTRSVSTWTQQARLLAADGVANDSLGISAALSDNGQIAFVGTTQSDTSGNENQGAVYAFTPTATAWAQAQKLTGACAPTASFGWANALSADGSTAIIGAPNADLEGVLDVGSAYIFTRSGSTWLPQARLVATDGAAKDTFGRAVAISADGSTVMVGAYGATVGGNLRQGAVYLFTRTGVTWAETQKLTVPGGADDWFGIAMAFSGDGNTAFIGASGADGLAGIFQGAVYVATRSGATWTIQPTPLRASAPGAADFFGRSVAASQDGGTLLIGAYGVAVGANASQGAAYVFTRSGSGWTEQQKFSAATGAADDWFGLSVALSDDGNLALVGAPGEESGMGRAYVFARSGATWSQQRQFTISGGLAEDHVGFSVALSGDGRIALVGSPGTDAPGVVDRGNAYLFVRDGSTWSPRDILNAAEGAANDAFGWSTALSRDGKTALIGASGTNIKNVSKQGAAYPYALDFPPSYAVYLPLLVSSP